MTATTGAIRDRVIALVAALTPTSLAADRFRHSLDEGAADFAAHTDAHPAGALRRFQVRSDNTTDPPEFSAVDQSLVTARFAITIAYPHDHRAGSGAARDRDDLIDEDWRKIDFAIGMYGRGNFSGAHDCTPLGASKRVERGAACDFLVVTTECTYYVDVDG